MIGLSIVAVGIALGQLPCAVASETAMVAQTSPTKAVDVGNTICPVTGDKIDEKTKATYEYKGKIYNFCCPMCIDTFKKDPQKYIKKVEEELWTAPKEETSQKK